MGSSQSRDQTRVPCISRQILNPWATREALTPPFYGEIREARYKRPGLFCQWHFLHVEGSIRSEKKFFSLFLISVTVLLHVCLPVCLWASRELTRVVIPLLNVLFVRKKNLFRIPLCSLDMTPVGTQPGNRSATDCCCSVRVPLFPPLTLSAFVLHCAISFGLVLPLADFSPRIFLTSPRNRLPVGLLHQLI